MGAATANVLFYKESPRDFDGCVGRHFQRPPREAQALILSWRKVVLCALALQLGSHAAAQGGLHALPPVLSAISDEVGVLSAPQGQALANLLGDVERDGGPNIIVLIVTTTQPETVEQYTQRLIQHWWDNSKELDRGRFVFVVLAKEDHAMRVVPSSDLTSVADSITTTSAVDKFRPLLIKGDYFEALVAMVKELSRLVNPSR